MRVLALSDLHVGHPANRESVAAIPGDADAWLLLGGDLGERLDHLKWTLDALQPRFAKLVWIPGNHELWVTDGGRRGEARYRDYVAVCRERGVLTPEDAWPEIDTGLVLCPLFLLYDYSFAPDGLDAAGAVAWAAEAGIVAQDERFLHPDPYPSRAAWCAARVDAAEDRLAALPPTSRTVLFNHWPLRRDLARLPLVPRYVPWCGTTRTEDWHVRFRAELVVTGHLHVRATDWRDGVRFEEVSLGYPRQWSPEKGAASYVRQVWPATVPAPVGGHGGPVRHR
jgi:3',5'-cyclic AMP phosphodiesterase CpdA